MASVKVAVRVRPLNSREKNMEAKCIIEMEEKRTSILNLKLSSYAGEGDEKAVHGRERVKDFFFDYSYWSCNPGAKYFAGQEKIFCDIGSGVLESASEGYNACIFAYGQTGSGKTHTMMGSSGNEGLIPRICEGLFAQMKADEDEGTSFRTEVSYLEIYNEKVRDLLRPPPKRAGSLHTLRVREHPKEGPYVQGLTKHLVSDYAAIEALMTQGNSHRTTAATNMNDVSSRSHAIFTINYTQAKFYRDMPSETVSKINLVDLAGSERADSTGATGVRLKEGGNINKSLVTLGSVISTLAESSTNPHKKNLFIPYRDSVLTWLLKDSLGGNSKTIMIATISPADCNYAETLSTLRYANRAKNIINKPTVNEDPNVKLIRDLRAEIDKLRSMLHQDSDNDVDIAAVKKLTQNEERLVELTDKWKDRWKETQKIMQERELALQRHQDIGVRMDSELPHLVALEDDLLSTGIILYHLKTGKTIIGKGDEKCKPDIVISGPDTKICHCLIENQNGFVCLSPQPDAPCFVNGASISKKVKLQQGDVVIIGKNNMFRFNHPAEAQELREKRKSIGAGISNLTMAAKFRSETDLLQKLRTSPDIAREKREEELTKQLEEARNELEKQKHEEERRLEEARHEFSKQIREESRRLEETRRELERKKRSRLYEEPTADEIRQQLIELEQRHREAEERRRHREEELINEISSKEERIRNQNKKLEGVERDCENLKERAEQSTSSLIDHFVGKRSDETKSLNEVLRTLVENERNKTENPGKDERVREEMLAVWKEKSEKVNRQENFLHSLIIRYQQKVNEVELSPLNSSAKREVIRERDQLERGIELATAALEEATREKAASLSEYQQDFRNRFDLVCLERDDNTTKNSAKYSIFKKQREDHRQLLEVANSKLWEAQEQQTETTKVLNEALKNEKLKVEEHRKLILAKREAAQLHFNETVNEYQETIKTDQEAIDLIKHVFEEKKHELLELTSSYFDEDTQDKEYLEKEVAKVKVDLEAKKRDLKTAEEQLAEKKKKIEVDVHRNIRDLNKCKIECDEQLKAEEEKITDLEQQSREAILLLQEDIDEAEKEVLQCKSDLQKDDERLLELRQTDEARTSKLDAELLYVAYLFERAMVGQNREVDFSSVLQSKQRLEDINERYREEVQQLQSQNELTLKPVVKEREQAQVVLEDLVRSRGVTEVALSELKEKFDRERKMEIAELENLREKLADIEEELNIAGNISRDEVTSLGAADFLSVEELLEKERKRQKHELFMNSSRISDSLTDEMETKISDVEAQFMRKMDSLRTEEEEKINLLMQEKERLEKEKVELETDIMREKVELQREREEREEIERERLQELERVIKEKEVALQSTQLDATKEIQDLRQKLDDSSREIFLLQEKLERYVSMTSLALGNRGSDVLSDHEVADLMMRVRASDDESIGGDSPPEITPPPTPINRFLASVNTFRRNQIKVSIPRYILRGLGRGSYHVFEVKLNLGDDNWSVYRRYRRFRELHGQLKLEYPVVTNLEFPSKRYFGNRAESFVRLRRAQLEAYLKALFAILSNLPNCCISATIERPLTKQDLGYFHSFFKQGIYEYSKYETE